jgi:hypothetical protein
VTDHIPTGEHGAAGHDASEFDGPAVLVAGDQELAVRVRLAAQFQPIAGRVQWYGRISADPALADLIGSRRTTVRLRPAGGGAGAEGEISDVDTWGRYRITGRGRPPWVSPADVR